MSTKIYNGRKFKNAPKSLKEIRDIIFKFKEKAMEHYRKKYYTLLARDIVKIIDDALVLHRIDYDFPHYADDYLMEKLGQQTVSSNTLWGAVDGAVERRSDIYRKQLERGGQFFQYDFYCNITVLPSNEEVFILLYTGDRNVEILFDSMEEIEEYPYWDNTDQPDGMTWKEWQKRGEEWDEAVGSGVPAQNGFGIDILADTLYVKVYQPYGNKEAPGPVEETMKYIPEFEDRVERLARITLWEEWEQENKKEIKDVEDSGKYSEYRKVAKRFDTFMEEEVDRVHKRKAEISRIIKPILTKDDLLVKVTDFIQNNNIKYDEENKE